MLQKIKCFFGFHEDKLIDGVTRCKHCPTITIKAITKEELEKMVERGDLPLSGYLSAINRGCLTKDDLNEVEDVKGLF